MGLEDRTFRGNGSPLDALSGPNDTLDGEPSCRLRSQNTVRGSEATGPLYSPTLFILGLTAPGKTTGCTFWYSLSFSAAYTGLRPYRKPFRYPLRWTCESSRGLHWPSVVVALRITTSKLRGPTPHLYRQAAIIVSTISKAK